MVYWSGFEKGPSWIKNQEDSSPLTELTGICSTYFKVNGSVQSMCKLLLTLRNWDTCVPDYCNFLLPVFHTLLLSFVRYPASCTSLQVFISRLFISIRVILKVTKCIKYRNKVFIEYHSASHERTTTGKGKGKAVPLQAWSGPEGSRKLRFPDFMTTAQEGGKVVSLTHRPNLPPGNPPGTHFC